MNRPPVVEHAPPRWPDFDFIRDDEPFEDGAPTDVTGWELIIFELEDDEQPVTKPG